MGMLEQLLYKTTFRYWRLHMLVGITQASKELGVSAEHIRRMIRANRWPGAVMGSDFEI